MIKNKKNTFARRAEQIEALESEKTTDSVPRKTHSNVLAQRKEIIASVQGKSRTVKHVLWDPKRISLWHGHNRDYGALSEARCSDLIRRFKEEGGQKFPAIVRKVESSTEYDYEIICGARRHWTATFLNRDLLIEVQDLDDREAFLLQDTENRDREDICDYERARDYAKALPVHFDGKKSRMAEELQIDNGYFSRLLALAELPEEIVEAYSDKRELVVEHMKSYARILKDNTQKQRVLDAAIRLKGKGLAGTQVVRELRKSAEPQGTTNKAESVCEFVAKRNRTGDYTIKIRPGENQASTIEKVKKEFSTFIQQLEADFDKPTGLSVTNLKNNSVDNS